jgi:hypothetical protein
MKMRMTSLVTVGAAGLLLAACSSNGTASSSTSSPSVRLTEASDCRSYQRANPETKATQTKDFVIVAGVGVSESMYTKTQVASTMPESGEVMVGGQMTATGSSSGGSMSMGSGTTMTSGSAMRHVEIHICSKATGKAVAGAMPTMDIQDMTQSGSMMQSMSVAEMRGLDMNPADTHYGNNVSLIPSHRYLLKTTMNGEPGSIEVTSPTA